MKFRFSIRDLLWLTLLCAVIVAWWLDHQQAMSIIAELEEQLNEDNWPELGKYWAF